VYASRDEATECPGACCLTSESGRRCAPHARSVLCANSRQCGYNDLQCRPAARSKIFSTPLAPAGFLHGPDGRNVENSSDRSPHGARSAQCGSITPGLRRGAPPSGLRATEKQQNNNNKADIMICNAAQPPRSKIFSLPLARAGFLQVPGSTDVEDSSKGRSCCVIVWPRQCSILPPLPRKRPLAGRGGNRGKRSPGCDRLEFAWVATRYSPISNDTTPGARARSP